MQISDYIRKILLISAALCVLIVGLSVILYNQGPRVRFIQGIDNISTSTLTANSSLQVIFDRPIEQRDYTDLISISPEVAFTSFTNTQSITLTLQGNLKSDTEYSILVTPEINDKSGKKMKNSYKYSFVTTKPSYAYIERNYGLDLDSSSDSINIYTDADDHIKIATIGAEPEIVFSHPRIISIAANDNYVVVAVEEEDRDELYTVNLNTKEVRHEQLWFKGRIDNLALAPRSKTALFTTNPGYSSVSTEYYEEYANRIESLNLDDGTLLSLTDVDDKPLKAYGINTGVDGQVALIQGIGNTRYAVSPFNDFNPVLIGSYSETFGFSKGGTEIIFRDEEGLVRYDIAKAEVTPIDSDRNSYVLDIESQDNVVTFSSSIYLPGLSYNQIERTEEGKDTEILWRSKESDISSLREFTISHDSALLALKLNPDKCEYDGLGSSSECKDVFQQIIDAETKEVLREFRGSNVVWLP